MALPVPSPHSLYPFPTPSAYTPVPVPTPSAYIKLPALYLLCLHSTPCIIQIYFLFLLPTFHSLYLIPIPSANTPLPLPTSYSLCLHSTPCTYFWLPLPTLNSVLYMYFLFPLLTFHSLYLIANPVISAYIPLPVPTSYSLCIHSTSCTYSLGLYSTPCTTVHTLNLLCLKHSTALILTPFLKPPSRCTCSITISELFFKAVPFPLSDAWVCVCVCDSVTVKCPVLPPCAVDGRLRNPLYYYYLPLPLPTLYVIWHFM